jgi:hypothetical protein
MKAYGGVDVEIHFFLPRHYLEVWSASRLGRSTPGGTAPGTNWIGAWVGPRTGLDDVEMRKFLTLPGLELRPLYHSALSQSLYRLRHPGSTDNISVKSNKVTVTSHRQ